MMQAVFPPGVIAVTLSGPISCLQNQRAGGVLFGRDMASKPWLDHDFFLETMIPKEAFTPNILHPLTYCYWSGHYMRFKAGDESSIL